MKTWHILLALLVLLTITFMQPLVTFLGGLMLLLGTGALIFRDLPLNRQEVIERQVLSWLRRIRSPDFSESEKLPSGDLSPQIAPELSKAPAKRARRTRKTISKSSIPVDDAPARTPAQTQKSGDEPSAPTTD